MSGHGGSAGSSAPSAGDLAPREGAAQRHTVNRDSQQVQTAQICSSTAEIREEQKRQSLGKQTKTQGLSALAHPTY